ncbi:HD-domain/PDEase-like protein [Mycena indigotica]|uniref:HD-domain/PDEase-like protein n=1 Tax=Mycena indigotica TaxID=2126181 RepID=A0A8H6SJV0_9AGAR|nr:HD-domain/PDEase-like protein [Mycena indigotica]KAF7300958.1 HD-domain/PDEase-like protein [Mycena indigotica]
MEYEEEPEPGRQIKDQIHDYIAISPLISSIIDTPEFQRLRNVKQLGTSYYVWSGASHNRFEHCLGVAHLARSMVEHLQRQQSSLGIDTRDVNCVEIAGLCHDLGHGPWSHVFDNLFIPAVLPGKSWKHEDASKMMFEALVANNSIQLPREDIEFILALIVGDRSQCSPREKQFLFDIVANTRNGLDVDKFDYIARDTYMIGEPTKISTSRLIKSARVIENEICYDIKDVNELFELCHTRFKLHKQVYTHKTARAIEFMIVDALKSANPFLRIAEQIEIPQKFLYLTDDIMTRIEASDDPELEEARQIFRRIRLRDLYKFVDQRVVEWERRELFKAYITQERVALEARRLAKVAIEAGEADPVDLSLLTPDTVIVDHCVMHYGMKTDNPLDSVRFYSKRHPKKCAPAQKCDYSMLMPPIFAEVKLTVYTKRPEYLAFVQAGYRAVLQSIPEDLPATPPVSARPLESVGPLTPPREKSNSLPRSRTASLASLTPNEFTTVPMNYVPSTPSRSRELKRSHSSTSIHIGTGSLLFGFGIPLETIEDEERDTKRIRIDKS